GDPTQGTIVTVRVSHANIEDERYFLFSHRFSGYGIAGKETYFWVPIGLFSTNFHPSSTGLPIAAMPVNIAFGARYHEDTWYLGGSLALGWLLYATPKDQPDASDTVHIQSV